MVYNKCNSKNAMNYCRCHMCTIARFCNPKSRWWLKTGGFLFCRLALKRRGMFPTIIVFFFFFLAVISAGSYYFSSEIHFPLSSTLWLFVLICYLILMLPVVVCGSLSLWLFLFTNDGWSNYSLKNFGDGGLLVF